MSNKHLHTHDAHGDHTHDRRSFFRRSAELAVQAGLLAGGIVALSSLRRGRNAPVGARVAMGMLRPPGSLGEADFLSSCIRCTRCADSCEPSCIKYFGPEAGRLQGTPYIDPIAKACTMCLKCGDACPTDAIRPLTEIGDIHMGVAEVDDRLCVSINGTGICGACFTACPLRGKAITQGIRNAPEVHPEFCTGCGLCEQFCIVDDRAGVRAIQVATTRSRAKVT